MQKTHPTCLRDAITNPDFRAVQRTGKHMQEVFMNIAPGDMLPMEHHEAEQYFVVVQGEAAFTTTTNMDRHTHNLGPGGTMLVTSHQHHEVKNLSSVRPLVLVTIYAPPKYPEGHVDKTRAEEA